MTIFTGPTCAIVTGAARGFGKAVSEALIQELQPGSTMVLLGRNSGNLAGTKEELGKLNASVSILVYSGYECCNLDEEGLSKFIETNLSSLSANTHLLLVHNSGTVGDPSQYASKLSFQEVNAYYAINFSAAVATNTIVIDKLEKLQDKTVINITSLAAVQPMKSLACYCSGKAARDMFFKVLAMENPSVKVLSYAPGPLETDMFDKIKDTSCDAEIKSTFQGIKPLTPLDSAKRMCDVLKANKFQSGDHFDYYDSIPE